MNFSLFFSIEKNFTDTLVV